MIEQFPSSHSDPEQSTTHEQGAPEDERRDMGKRILFRVMNLDDHSGVRQHHDDGAVDYVVDNQQYPDQGDFAFQGDGAAAIAITRAYPRNLHNVHAVEVDPQHVVEPYPDDMPGVVYIKNGAEVRAHPVPKHLVDEYTDKPDMDPVELTRRTIDELFASREEE